MGRQISLTSLRDVAVLYPGDVHELARFVLKAGVARDREANARNPSTVQSSRPTLHGLARQYSQVTDIKQIEVERALVEAGLDLGAVVEFDSDDSVA
jgi:hypothetical protein